MNFWHLELKAYMESKFCPKPKLYLFFYEGLGQARPSHNFFWSGLGLNLIFFQEDQIETQAYLTSAQSEIFCFLSQPQPNLYKNHCLIIVHLKESKIYPIPEIISKSYIFFKSPFFYNKTLKFILYKE